MPHRGQDALDLTIPPIVIPYFCAPPGRPTFRSATSAYPEEVVDEAVSLPVLIAPVGCTAYRPVRSVGGLDIGESPWRRGSRNVRLTCPSHAYTQGRQHVDVYPDAGRLSLAAGHAADQHGVGARPPATGVEAAYANLHADIHADMDTGADVLCWLQRRWRRARIRATQTGLSCVEPQLVVGLDILRQRCSAASATILGTLDESR